MAWAGARAHMPRTNEMETAMTTREELIFAPRTIAQARRLRAVYFGRILRIATRRTAKRIAGAWERIMQAYQHHHELELLLQADDRMLSDIGMTRAEVRAVASGGGWTTPSRMIDAVVERRAEAMRTAHRRHGALPQIAAPSLAAGQPVMTFEPSNFR